MASPEAELPHSVALQRAFDNLVISLRQSRESFVPDHEAGREAVVRALRSVLHFLVVFPTIEAEGLHVPLGHLLDAVKQLDDGITQPMLRATKEGGRAKDSGGRDALKGFVVYWLQLATDCHTGKTFTERLNAASRSAASILNGQGIKPSRGGGTFSARTLRNWREVVSRDVGARTEAGRMLKHLRQQGALFQPPADMPTDQQRSALLQILNEMISQYLSGKPANPPS